MDRSGTRTGRIVALQAGGAGFVKEARDRLVVDAGGAHGDRHHGRDPSRALLMVSDETYRQLAAEGLRPPYGSLGENVVVSGLPPGGLAVGTRLSLGGVGAVVTGPCPVCRALAHVDRRLPRAVAGRRGDYLRVERGGTLRRGDAVRVDGVPAGADAGASVPSEGAAGAPAGVEA